MGDVTPLVTVAVTTRDRTELLQRAIASALAQTIRDVEIIVVDDGSAVPPTIQGDARVRCIRLSERRGVCAARNVAIDAATGRWITFLDDDDQLLPDMLEVSLRAADRSHLAAPVAVLTAVEVLDLAGGWLEVRRPPTLSRGRDYFLEDSGDDVSFQTQNSLVVPVSVVREIGGWDERLRAMEHDDFFLRLNAAASIEGMASVGYRLTAHRGPRLSRDLAARADAMARIVATHRPVFRRHARKYAQYLGTMAITQLRAGRWRPAIAAASRSLMLDVRRPKAWRQWAVSLGGPGAWRAIDRIRRPRLLPEAVPGPASHRKETPAP